MKKTVFFIAFLFTFVPSFSQITGTVVDSVRIEPIVGAAVYFKVLQQGTETDLDGFFELDLSGVKKSDTLVVSYLGYKDYFVPLSEYKNKSLIYLVRLPLKADGIEVEAERIGFAAEEVPAITQRLDVKEIEISVTGDLKSVLRQIPSVQVIGNPIDGSYIQIRGSNPDEVRVFVDGFLINSLSFENKADISIINTENIKHMVVQKGGNSLIQGLGSAGGVVNIETKTPQKVEANALAIRGDFDSKRYSFDFGAPLNDNFSLRLYYTHNTVNPELKYKLSAIDPTIVESYNILSRKDLGDMTLYYSSPKGRVSLKYVYLKQKDDKSLGDWNRERAFSLLGFSYLGSMFGTDNWRIIYNQNTTEQKELRAVTSKNAQYLYNYSSKQTNFRLQKMILYKELKWTLAYEFFHDELDNNNEYFENREKYPIYRQQTHDNLHSFTTIMSMLDTTANVKNLRWNIFASFRENMWVSGQSDYVTNFSVMLNRQLRNKRWEAHITYGRNVKYPTLLQNAYAGNIADFTGSEFLERLKPEYFSSFEAGAYYTFRYPARYVPRMKIEASVFSTEIRHKIIQQPIDQGLILIQSGYNTTKGVEAAIYLNDLFYLFNASLTGTVLNISNQQSYPYKPNRLFRFNISYAQENGPYSAFSLFYEGDAYSWYYTPGLELKTLHIDPFTDIDLTLGWKQKFRYFSFNLQLAVRNLLDNSNYQDLYLKRRYYQASLSLGF